MIRRSGRHLSSYRRFHAVASRQGGRPLIDIKDATFYRSYPSETTTISNPALFPNLTFTLPDNKARKQKQEHWSVLSSSSLARTTFLRVLAGSFIALPPTSRTYPGFAEHGAHHAASISYIGFDAERTGPAAVRGAYLSARYEARKEETDFTLLDYLTGNTVLNPVERSGSYDKPLLERCVKDLRLSTLLSMPVGNSSNGQTRRARIAKELMTKPELLLLDGPFMGLDPPSVKLLSTVLQGLAEASQPRLVLSLRQGDLVPDWTTHLVAVDSTSSVQVKGPKQHVLTALASGTTESKTPQQRLSTDGFPATFPPRKLGAPVVEISGASVRYGDSPRPVLGGWAGGLHLTIRQGQRVALLGPNGSGKTTLLSLITSDHPQAYSQPVRIFGRSRLPEPGQKGISVFELQRRIGHSSPEVHAFFPRHLSVRRALESAWADAPLARPVVAAAEAKRVDRVLAWFGAELRGDAAPEVEIKQNLAAAEELHRREADLTWAQDVRFGGLPFSSQRLLLFLRAMIAGQQLIVLDEAFSGMDRSVREKAFLFMAHGDQDPLQDSAADVRSIPPDSVVGGLTDQQALLVIAHDRGDVPGCIRDWVCLPEPAGEGEEQAPPRTGELAGPLELNPDAWGEMWGEPVQK